MRPSPFPPARSPGLCPISSCRTGGERGADTHGSGPIHVDCRDPLLCCCPYLSLLYLSGSLCPRIRAMERATSGCGVVQVEATRLPSHRRTHSPRKWEWLLRNGCNPPGRLRFRFVTREYSPQRERAGHCSLSPFGEAHLQRVCTPCPDSRSLEARVPHRATQSAQRGTEARRF